jgi:hypothetical protein
MNQVSAVKLKQGENRRVKKEAQADLLLKLD